MTNIITLDDFKQKFKEIKKQGWIKTHKYGNTGVGKTLEDLLGIAENNIQGPDFGIYELKAQRETTTSSLSLFTSSPKPRGAIKKLVDKYGYYSDEMPDPTKKILYMPLSTQKYTKIPHSSKSLKIEYKNIYIDNQNKSHKDVIIIKSNIGNEDAYWEINNLTTKISKKFNEQIVYVKAKSKGQDKNEEFKYTEAYLLKGITSKGVIDMIKDGKIDIEIRYGQYDNPNSKNYKKSHDHGTAFRITNANKYILFSNNERLDEE